jgi:molybdenum cofactor synthesis domain-containing protein
MPTAAVIIIGNEILSAKFSDENGPWLIKRCRELGIDMVRVSTITDEVDVIAAEVKRSSEVADFVFTSGGIGPTHDDVTMAGIAEAFGSSLQRNPQLVELIEKRMGSKVTEDALRMADLPEETELWIEPGMRFPVCVCRNVLIFPGVPGYLRGKFNDIAHRLGGEPITSRQLSSLKNESAIAGTLRQAADRWPTVNIGSYPRLEETPKRVIVTMDSRDLPALEACHAWLSDALSQTSEQQPQVPLQSTH